MPLIKVVGVDLAKLVFSIHGVDEYGKSKLRKTVKRDKLLAEAICEAICRPKTRYISIKSEEQQAVLCLLRIRQGALVNAMKSTYERSSYTVPEQLWRTVKTRQTEPACG